ncbi:MAG TPA: hypothetical protein VMU89_19700 [Thermomicrobiaceae bacterium]|nr:hypothetical protein [Thermomicrobiaceae bacterium]
MQVYLRTGNVRIIAGVAAARVETVATGLEVRRMLVCRDGSGQSLARFDAAGVLAFRVAAPRTAPAGEARCRA